MLERGLLTQRAEEAALLVTTHRQQKQKKRRPAVASQETAQRQARTLRAQLDESDDDIMLPLPTASIERLRARLWQQGYLLITYPKQRLVHRISGAAVPNAATIIAANNR